MDKIAEIIEAATGEFTAQSYRLHWAPPLGSLVKTCTRPGHGLGRTVGEADGEATGEALEPLLQAIPPLEPRAETPSGYRTLKGAVSTDEYFPAGPLRAQYAAIYGVVCYSSTASLEPGRRPVARGRDLTEEEDVYLQNPQLARLLCTNFKALIVGYHDGGRLRRFLPPNPPRVHAFVYTCRQAEVAAFTSSLDFLTLLLGASLPIPADELVAACLRGAAGAREDGRAFLVRAGKELALLLAGDPARLNSILRKIRP